MKKTGLIVGLLLLGFPGYAHAEKEFKVVVFGDSLASGYQIQPEDAFPAKLERKIRAAGYNRLTMVNISKATATTATATKDIDLVKAEHPDVIVIMLGINDVMRRVLPSATYGNLDNIVRYLKMTNAYLVLVGMTAPAANGELYQREILNTYYTLAKAHQLPFYPAALAGIEGNPAYTMADGVHPNALGVELMVENIFPYVDTGLRWRNDVYNYEQELMRIQTPSALLPPP